MNKTFALAEVKSLDGDSPNGEFEAVLSAATLDRDGEVIQTGAFDPLPASVPVHAYHDFRDPIGRGVPYYEDDVLKLRGVFASTPRAQEIRSLVSEGIIGSMSVGFMGAQREERDGVPHVTKGELLEGSFVSIPSNREAAVTMAKTYAEETRTVTEVADPETSDDTSDEETPVTDPEDETGSSAGAEEAPADDPVVDPPADVDEEQLAALEVDVLAPIVNRLAQTD